MTDERLTDEQITAIETALAVNTYSTHFPDCHLSHYTCAIRVLAAALRRERGSPKCGRCGQGMKPRHVGVQVVALACPVCFMK